MVMELIHISRRIYSVPKFVFYAISDGILILAAKAGKGIADMLRLKPTSLQLSFWPDLGFLCSGWYLGEIGKNGRKWGVLGVNGETQKKNFPWFSMRNMIIYIGFEMNVSFPFDKNVGGGCECLYSEKLSSTADKRHISKLICSCKQLTFIV